MGKKEELAKKKEEELAKYDWNDTFRPANAGKHIVFLDGKQFHINETDGLPAYSQRYDKVDRFYQVEDGVWLARVFVDGDRGGCRHIHPDGTPAYNKKFKYAGNFHSGLAPTRNGNVYRYIKPDGSFATFPNNNFEHAGNFQEGVALVKRRGRVFQILPDGTELPEAKDDDEIDI